MIRTKKYIILKIMFGLIIVIIFFIGIEISSRFYMYYKTNKKEYLTKFTVENSPKSTKEIQVYGKIQLKKEYYKLSPGRFKSQINPIWFTINSLGFRSAEFSLIKSTGVTRICVLGASSTFGVEVNDNETYPFYMQKIFDSFSGKYEVINCGFPNYNMKNIYNILKNEVIMYKPDFIIINSVCNDSFQPNYSLTGTLLFKLHQFLYYRCIFYTLILEKYSFINNNEASPYFYRPKNIPPDFTQYLASSISLAKENGIKVILIKEPMNFDDARKNYTLTQLKRLYISSKNLEDKNKIAYYYNIKQLEKIGTEKNCLIIQPKEVLVNFPEYFIDIVHLSPGGYKLLAELIVKKVTEIQGIE